MQGFSSQFFVQRILVCQIAVYGLTVGIVVRQCGVNLCQIEMINFPRDILGCETQFVPSGNSHYGHSGAGDVTEVSYDLSAGDQVHIVGGAFAGLEAVVTQVLSPKERVKILMHFLGRKMEAEVQCSSVLRQVTHPLAA